MSGLTEYHLDVMAQVRDHRSMCIHNGHVWGRYPAFPMTDYQAAELTRQLIAGPRLPGKATLTRALRRYIEKRDRHALWQPLTGMQLYGVPLEPHTPL